MQRTGQLAEPVQALKRGDDRGVHLAAAAGAGRSGQRHNHKRDSLIRRGEGDQARAAGGGAGPGGESYWPEVRTSWVLGAGQVGRLCLSGVFDVRVHDKIELSDRDGAAADGEELRR